MGKRIAVTVAAAALAVAGVAIGQQVASAGGHGGAVVATEKFATTTVLDLGEAGWGQGDTLVYTSDLLGKGDEKVGHGAGECVLVTPKGDDQGVFTCSSSYVLGDSEIVAVGLFDSTAAGGRLPVVGGTGEYNGASGTLDFVTESADTFALTFNLED